MSSKHKSNSRFQSEQESPIIDAFLGSEFFEGEEETNMSRNQVLNNTDNIKMQLDLYLPKAGIIGEVYVTELPFNSGRKRKFQSDVLKMITFDQLHSGKRFKKYYFLTADEERLKKIDPSVCQGQFVKHSRESSLIGRNTWLNLALESFNITLLYYCVGNDELKKLRMNRKRQKEGMKKAGRPV